MHSPFLLFLERPFARKAKHITLIARWEQSFLIITIKPVIDLNRYYSYCASSRIGRKLLVPHLPCPLLTQLLSSSLQHLLYPLSVHPNAHESDDHNEGEVKHKCIKGTLLFHNDDLVFVYRVDIYVMVVFHFEVAR